jgi:outer membrane protein assembly factor BamE (lipoprotein component of BamABCDE complex)
MTTPQIVIFDALTGKTITRDFNEIELAQFEADQAQAKKDSAEQTKANQAAADKRQQILDRLGITNEELLAILL